MPFSPHLTFFLGLLLFLFACYVCRLNVVNLINVQEQENLFPSSLGTTGWSKYRENPGIQEGLDTRGILVYKRVWIQGESWYAGGSGYTGGP